MALGPMQHEDTYSYSSKSYSPQYAYTSTSYWKAERKGDMVVLHGNVISSSAPVGTAISLLTLDNEYKPSSASGVVGTDGLNGRRYSVDVNTTGVVTLYIYGTQQDTIRCSGCTISYIAAN